MNKLQERSTFPYEKTPDGVALPAQRIYSNASSSTSHPLIDEELKLQANIENVSKWIQDAEKIKLVSMRLMAAQKRSEQKRILQAILARLEHNLKARDALDKPLIRLRSLKASITKAVNATCSHAEALKAGDPISVSSAVEDYVDLVEDSKNILAQLQSKLEAVKNEIRGDSSDAMDDEIIRLLKNIGPERERLQSIRNRDYMIARVPVVPLTSGILNPKLLEKQGFKVDRVGNTQYVILHNQLVFGIRADLSPKQGRKITKPLDFLKDLIPQMEKNLGQQLVLASDVAYKWDSGIWYWLMLSKDMARIQRAIPGFKVKRWGFAFN